MTIRNREVSEKLNVNFAKWKRWSREFLPPDPMAGMQSGYTREYTLDECFTVYLGGHLVSSLKFSVPNARGILKDLIAWLKGKEFLPLDKYRDKERPAWTISICSGAEGFTYSAKGILENAIVENSDYEGPGIVFEERYISELFGSGTFDPGSARMLDLTIFIFRFLGVIGS